ncbi:MAG: hypothetical protein IT373_30140 [Polyangiaceae bacterium]|nr:hypothetical protein [Polyangiaceae bacterium]
MLLAVFTALVVLAFPGMVVAAQALKDKDRVLEARADGAGDEAKRTPRATASAEAGEQAVAAESRVVTGPPAPPSDRP